MTEKKKTGSLRLQVLWVTLAGLALGVLIFFGISQLGGVLIRESYMSAENVNRRRAKLYADFNAYVTNQSISARDTAAVACWTASHEYVTIFLFSTGREQQLYAGGKLDPGAHSAYDPQVHGRLYTIRFADGMYQVAIGDNSQVRQRNLVSIAAFLAAGISFLLLFMWYTGRLTRRIIDLSREAAAVSEGDLERSITAAGGDELSALADYLAEDTDYIINLASKEYSSTVAKHLPADVQMITCVFGEKSGDRIVEKGTLCKMARGEMVRRMAEQNVQTPEELKSLQLSNYAYEEALSDAENFVYLKKNM